MRANSEYLKGFAIFMVMAGHYFDGIIPEQYFVGGNGFVSIFFVLSGYGIHHSLSRQFSKPTLKSLVLFYVSRAKRLYPLYWIYCIILLLMAKVTLSDLPITAVFAINFTAPSFLWFIPAIVQCYLVAPLLFICLRHYRLSGLVVLVAAIITMNFTAPFLGLPPERVWVYRGLYFNSILMFLLGMTIPLFRAQPLFAKMYNSSLVFFLLFLCVILQQRYQVVTFTGEKTVFAFLLSATTLFFCVSFLGSSGKPPLAWLFRRLGVYTYSLYIFHTIYFSFFDKLLLKDTVQGVLAVVAVFPVFFLCVAFVEEMCTRDMNARKALLSLRTNLFPKSLETLEAGAAQ